MNTFLDKLNQKQQQAVTHTEGPVLILAGAGSGKTTVLVNRISYILETTNARAYNILAITFTNKAANEMKERIAKLLGQDGADIWIGTFHSTCVRILRRYIERIGYTNSFVIYDSQDTQRLIKDCMKELNISEDNFKPRAVLSEISRAKNDMIDVNTYLSIYATDYRKNKLAGIYKLYQKRLKDANAMDFDDIIMNTIKLFSENIDVLEHYQNQFKYILVDEYQDTNNSQYMLVSMLSQKHRNLCVVGDDDQSIYKFRGANINNILNFEQEFEDALVIKLEQNYRSTQTILNAANSVISNNRGRKGKALWTDNAGGDKILVCTCDSERHESEYICANILELTENGEYSYKDFALLYRTNAQSRALEEALLKNAIPYKVLAGTRFYDRKEIKDMVAYLRVIQNPNDNISLKRIINEPKRGIGLTTLDKVEELAISEDISMFEILKKAQEYPNLSRAAAKLSAFVGFVSAMQSIVESENRVGVIVDRVLQSSGYISELEEENTNESKGRIENLNEFISVATDYDAKTEEASLSGFLENVSLMSDIDGYDDEQEVVVLMTIHSAKGLEFPVVFLTGLEEGLFPSMRSVDEEDIEEERRLCYVAITRAKNKLFITNANYRNAFGSTSYNPPSRFLDEIDKNYIQDITKKATGFKKALKENGLMPEFDTKPINNFKRELTSFAKKVTTPTNKNINFKKGDIVEHKKFGKGIILSALSIGNDMKLEIEFDGVGKKNLMAIFANLTKISS